MTMKNNIGQIQDLEELQLKVRSLKRDIREQEKDLEERWDRLPHETIKATVGAVIPVFLDNRVASGAWKMIKEGLSFFFSRGDKEGSWKEKIAGPVKQVGFFAALKMLYSLFKR